MIDSLLQETEVPICQLDLLSREICCLPCTQIQGTMKRLLRFVWPSDYDPLLLILVGTSNTSKGDLEHIKCDYMAPGEMVRAWGPRW